jgi:hypothetical protein
MKLGKGGDLAYIDENQLNESIMWADRGSTVIEARSLWRDCRSRETKIDTKSATCAGIYLLLSHTFIVEIQKTKLVLPWERAIVGTWKINGNMPYAVWTSPILTRARCLAVAIKLNVIEWCTTIDLGFQTSKRQGLSSYVWFCLIHNRYKTVIWLLWALQREAWKA